MTKFLEKNKLIVQEQNGFRKMCSCLDLLHTLVSVIVTIKLN